MMVNYGYGVVTAGTSAGNCIFYIVLTVALVIAWWKMFEKADVPGWASLIPLYSTYKLFQIAMGNGWLFLLMFVPIVNIIMGWYCLHKLSLAFGHGIGFTLGLIFLSPIFMLILGLDSSQYQGPQ